nr:phenylalanine aminomutase (l-beta-phenylalanine forming) [Quercus suber]
MLNEDKRRLLSGDNDAGSDDNEGPTFPTTEKSRGSRRLVLILAFCLVVSVSLNVYSLAQSWHQTQGTPNVPSSRRGRPSYSGLEYNVPKNYTYHTEFWNDTGITSDEHWEAISIDPAVIAVSPEWAASQGLPPSWTFPWDTTKQMYFIKVFHQLHCLKLIRRALLAWQAGENATHYVGHIGHCLDALRQDLMCHADDTPMPSTRRRHSLGDGQETQCMDFDKLVAWAQQPERYACHRHIHEYEPVIHGVERFAFCPEDSPFRGEMEAYFEKHGHKDPTSE